MASKHGSDNNKKNTKSIIVLLIITVVLLLISIYFFTKSQNYNNITRENDDRLVGTWTTDDVTVYEFDGEGNGKMILPSSEYKYTYVLHDNKIYIDFESDKAEDSDYEYSFEEDKLILKGIKATTGVYKFSKK